MKIYLLFDYDDRPIRASCDGKKLEGLATAMNDGDTYPYFVSEMNLEDVPQKTDKPDAKSRCVCEHLEPIKK